MIAPPEPGIHYDVPFADYLKWPYLSKSLLAEIAKSPGHLLYRCFCPLEVTSSMIFGSATGDLVTAGRDAFDVDYPQLPTRADAEKDPFVLVPPGVKLTTDDGKAWRARMEAGGLIVCKPADFKVGALSLQSGAGQNWKALQKSKGREVLGASDRARSIDCAGAIAANPRFREITEGASAEVSIVWDDPETGVRLKGRADFVPPADYIDDLKTIKEGGAELSTFRDTVFYRLYHWQAAMYLDGWTIASGEIRDRARYIVAETSYPFRVEVHNLPMGAIEQGRAGYRDALRLYADCIEDGDWPTSTEQIKDIHFTKWQQKRGY